MTDGPLGNIRVVEIASFVAGPYCGKLLADFGADVVKIEAPEVGDPSRRQGPFPDGTVDLEKSGLFLYLNTNKRSVTLDIADPRDRSQVVSLLKDADVLIVDRTWDEMKELGLGVNELQSENPDLITVSITPFGSSSAKSAHSSDYLNTFHASGQGYMLPMNSPNLDREPVRGARYLGESDSGLTAAIAVLAAYFWRRRGGTGQFIDISKQQSIMHLEKSQLRRFIDDGKVPNRTGKGRLLETIVRCKDDRHALIVLSSQLQWSGLVKAMDSPQWAFEPPFDTQQGRSDNYPELHKRLQAWASNFSSEEVFRKIQSSKSAAAPIYSAGQLAESPQTEARDYLVEYNHPRAGSLMHPGQPFLFSKTQWKGARPAPLLGEHTEEVLGGIEADSKREAERIVG